MGSVYGVFFHELCYFFCKNVNYQVICSLNSVDFNSGFVRLCFFRQQDFGHGHMTSKSPLQICFMFFRSCNFV